MAPIIKEKKVVHKDREKKINIGSYKRHVMSCFTSCKFFCIFEFAALFSTCPSSRRWRNILRCLYVISLCFPFPYLQSANIQVCAHYFKTGMGLNRIEGRYSLEVYVVFLFLSLVPKTVYQENFLSFLEELRGKEYMGISEASWSQKRNNMQLSKKVK